MSSSFDPYDILDIPRDAEPVEIRRAYQKLARRWHPEVNPGDAEAARHYAEAARAYRILADPETRRRFDRQPVRSERGGQRGWITYEKFLAVHAEWTAAEPREAGSERRGADLTADLTLDLAEAVRGVTASFSVQREVSCEACGGRGRDGEADCDACGGRGQVVELDRLRVRIPPGVDEGTRLKVPGKGNPVASELGGGRRAEQGRSYGDLFVTVRVRPHPYFVRQGLDIHGDLPVRFDEAILGADIAVPTIHGPVRVKLPAGTPGGQRFRLAGKGVEMPSGRRGDHYYTVRIVVPARVDSETEALLRRLTREDPRRGLPDEPL